MKNILENGQAEVGQAVGILEALKLCVNELELQEKMAQQTGDSDLLEALNTARLAINKAQTFSQKLDLLHAEVLGGYKSFFRNDSAVCDLRLIHTVASTQNENVEILGVFLSGCGKEISLIGQSNDGEEFYQPIESCLVNDLIYVLEQLHAKQYEQY